MGESSRLLVQVVVFPLNPGSLDGEVIVETALARATQPRGGRGRDAEWEEGLRKDVARSERSQQQKKKRDASKQRKKKAVRSLQPLQQQKRDGQLPTLTLTRENNGKRECTHICSVQHTNHRSKKAAIKR
jgi:hypothetical protein